MSYAEEFDSELDSDPDDAKKKSKANMAVALMDSTEDLDDEVERVLGHRWGIPHSFCLFSIPTSERKEKKRKEKTTFFGVNLMRSQVLYRAAQSPRHWSFDRAAGGRSALLLPMPLSL